MKTIFYHSKTVTVLQQISICLFLLIWWGCGTAGPKIVKTTRVDAVSENDKKVTKNGISVSVTPVIGGGDAAMFPELASKFFIMEKPLFSDKVVPVEYKTSNIFNSGVKVGETKVFNGTTLVIKITNNTGNSISLDGITITANMKGKDFQMEEYNSLYAKFLSNQLVDMANTLSSLNYVGKSSKQKVLPGKTATLYAAFNTEITEGTGAITFQVYDLVTKTDMAGNPTERTNFDFSYNEITVTETVQPK